MSEQTRQLIAAIRERLRHTRRRLTVTAVLAGVLITVGLASFLWIIAVLIETAFWLPRLSRSLVLAIVLLVAGWAIAREILAPMLRYFGLLRGLDDISLARRIGRRFPEISDRLVNLLQLAEGAHSSAPNDLLDTAVRSLGEGIQPIPFEKIAGLGRVNRFARVTALPILSIFVLAGATPDLFSEASNRLLSPLSNFVEPAPFSIILTPGDIEIIKGESVRVAAGIDGDVVPDRIALEYRIVGEVRYQAVELDPDASGWYHYEFPGIRQSLDYRGVAGSVSSEWYHVAVLERPIVQRIDVSLVYPPYTRLPEHHLDSNAGDIAALRGTRVTIRAILGGAETVSGSLVFDSGERLPLTLTDTGGTGTFRIETDARYRIDLLSRNGVSNDDPITHEIEVIEDEVPSAAFLSPDPQSLLTESVVAPLRVRISDDFGFSSMRLFYRLAQSRFGSGDDSFSSIPIRLPGTHILDLEIAYEWKIRNETNLDPVPGDAIEYFVRVWDNDRVLGPKSASTETYTLRFPSLAEQYEALESAEEHAEETLDELFEEARRVRERFEKFQEDLRRKPETDWQDERRIEQLQSQQESLESSVDRLSDQIEEMTDQMADNDLVSEETLDMFRELQEVIAEVNSPELMDALRDLQEALQNMDLTRMQQSLEDFQFNEQMYQQRLERTLEIFRQARIQKDLDEVIRRIEDLAELEKRLESETEALENVQQNGAGSGAERLAKEQEQAARDMQDIEKKLQDIRQDMEELRRAPVNRMKDLEEDTKDLELPKNMNDNARQLRDRDLDNARRGQQRMQRQLNNLQGRMSRMKMDIRGRQMEMNVAGLRSILEDILTLSESQEALRTETVELVPESSRLRESAQRQVELSEGLTVVADSLQGIAKEVPRMTRSVQQHVGDALREMGLATEAIADQVVPKATGHQKASMTHLNELALILSDLLGQMMNAQGSGSGAASMQQLLEQIQNLGQQQQKLNQQIQQLLNDIQGNRFTSDLMVRLRQLGGQQDQIRRDLKKLGRERNARNKILGDLNRIAEQMLESIEDLAQGRVSRTTIQRQRQILTRLLEASKSLQQRGKDRKRESRRGEDIHRESPVDLTPSEQIERLRRDLFRALDSGYTSDFNRLIRRYFELLQERSERSSDEQAR